MEFYNRGIILLYFVGWFKYFIRRLEGEVILCVLNVSLLWDLLQKITWYIFQLFIVLKRNKHYNITCNNMWLMFLCAYFGVCIEASSIKVSSFWLGGVYFQLRNKRLKKKKNMVSSHILEKRESKSTWRRVNLLTCSPSGRRSCSSDAFWK